jgi:hypothetical protein
MTDTKLLKSALVLGVVAVGCLVGVGLLFTWTAALAVVLVELLLWLGYWLAHERLAADRERIQRERAALDEAWGAFDRTRRIWGVYDNARQAMRTEAQRHWPVQAPDQQGQR